MTGMSARSVGSTKIRYDFFNVPNLLKQVLEELGHEVDMRTVAVDESDTLEQYDRVVGQLNWASSLSSMHAHEAGLAMARAGDRLRVYVDDWRAQTLADDIDYHIHRDRGWERHTTKFRPTEYARLTMSQRAVARNAYRRLLFGYEGASVPMLVPFFNWGDHDKFFGAAKAGLNIVRHDWDPSPFVHIPPQTDLRDQKFQWVLASLQNHDRWVGKLGLTWPMIQYGGVKKGGGGIRAGGPDKVVSEAEVVQAYADSWGVLSPPYSSAGSGYWRVRFNYASQVGAVIYCGPVDGAAIGPSFTNDIEDIEMASEEALEQLAGRQYQQLFELQSTPEEARAAVERWLE